MSNLIVATVDIMSHSQGKNDGVKTWIVIEQVSDDDVINTRNDNHRWCHCRRTNVSRQRKRKELGRQPELTVNAGALGAGIAQYRLGHWWHDVMYYCLLLVHLQILKFDFFLHEFTAHWKATGLTASGQARHSPIHSWGKYLWCPFHTLITPQPLGTVLPNFVGIYCSYNRS